MAFKKPDSFDGLDIDALQKLSDEALAEAREILGADDEALTDEQIAQAEALMADHAEIVAEIETRAAVEAERAARIAALRGQAEVEETEEETDEEVTPEAEAEEEAEVVEEEKEPVAAAATPRGGAVRKAAPKAPAVVIHSLDDDEPKRGTIVAAANVPGIETGSELVDIAQLADAFVKRSRSFWNRPAPTGEVFERFGVANIKKPENEFTITSRTSVDEQMEIINAVTKEARLPKGGLIAAGGWCAPSENLYNFAELEQVSGLISLPEVTITHGGINFTKGPQLAELLADADFGFIQTEAQAEAATVKPVFDITCPPFTEVRMDVIGYAIRAGILTASPGGWPELVRRFLSLAILAHQRKLNANTITRLSTAIGAATDFVELGGATADVLDALSLQAWVLRQKLFLNESATIEVILPVWAREPIRADLARRGGVENFLKITDQQIDQFFAVRNLAVQYVNDYQPLPTSGVGHGTAWPTTLEALLYPAGSYVRGTNDVISLDTVYDSPNLVTNTYLAAFFEEGQMLFNPAGEGRKVTIALTDIHGRVGEATIPGPATLT